MRQALNCLHLIIYYREALFTLFGSLSDKLHKLIQLRRDDNLGTAVALFASISGIGLQRIVFATTTSSETLGIYTIIILKSLNDT